MFLAAWVFCVSSVWLVRGANSAPRIDDPFKLNSAPNLGVRQNNASPTCLDPDVIQTASALTGQEDGTDGIKEGQAPPET
jgi:hypothetical protein